MTEDLIVPVTLLIVAALGAIGWGAWWLRNRWRR